MTDAGLVRPRPSDLEMDVTEATRQIAFGYKREERLRALAAVGMWRTLTTEQAATITNNRLLTTRYSRDRQALWASGLVQRGQFQTGFRRQSVPDLMRVDNSSTFDLLETMLSYEDIVGVTAGVPWRWGTQFDRHNLLANELLLRVAEYTAVGGVFGEQLASVSLIAPPKATVSRTSTRSADGLMVRLDGMKIAIEVTATVNRDTRQKVEKWAKVLTEDASGTLAVLFVDVPHPDRPAKQSVSVHLAQAIYDATATMGARMARAHERMMVVRWQDWFPARSAASPRFQSLTAYRPTGPRGDRWQDVNLLDPESLVFARPGSDATAILDNQHLLYGVPYWMRHQNRGAGVIERALLARNGYDGPVRRERDDPFADIAWGQD